MMETLDELQTREEQNENLLVEVHDKDQRIDRLVLEINQKTQKVVSVETEHNKMKANLEENSNYKIQWVVVIGCGGVFGMVVSGVLSWWFWKKQNIDWNTQTDPHNELLFQPNGYLNVHDQRHHILHDDNAEGGNTNIWNPEQLPRMWSLKPVEGLPAGKLIDVVIRKSGHGKLYVLGVPTQSFPNLPRIVRRP